MISAILRHQRGDFLLDQQFETEETGVTALFGPSGCGKTTTLMAIAGLLRPDSGHINIGDAILFDSNKKIDIAPEERSIGFVFQDARLFPHLSVRNNLLYGAKRKKQETAALPLSGIVELLGLANLLERYPYQLSGGEQQRTAIGRALMSAPRLLLFDEPLAFLDEQRKAEIVPFLERLHRNLKIPVFYVTHSLEEVIRLADSIVLMDKGRTIAAGSVESVLCRTDLPLLTQRPDAGVAFPARIERHDRSRSMSLLSIGPLSFSVPLLENPAGENIRLRILARDVAIAIKMPEGLSIHNILPCRVTEIVPHGKGSSLVRLEIEKAGTSLLSLITEDSIHALDLAIGKPVFALIKSVASGIFD